MNSLTDIEAHKFAKHPDFTVRVDRIGTEKTPVVVIDHFLEDASLLVDFIIARPEFHAVRGYYPGVRSPAPGSYVRALHQYLQEIVYPVFALPDDAITQVECDYSMVVTPPDKLSPFQRIPHFDSNNPQELAVMHYLCGPEFGGTSFYRHRASGYESVNQRRKEPYLRLLEQDAQRHGMPAPAYINGDTELFERIASYDACFNRALIYRCTSLHSGNIGEDFQFELDPKAGRLSINTFLVGD